MNSTNTILSSHNNSIELFNTYYKKRMRSKRPKNAHLNPKLKKKKSKSLIKAPDFSKSLSRETTKKIKDQSETVIPYLIPDYTQVRERPIMMVSYNKRKKVKNKNTITSKIKGINYSSKEPSICSVMFERKCLDYNKLEVDRFARYVNSHKVYYVSFSIPRRNPGFDPTLYPPVAVGEPSLTYDDWVGGKNGEPIKKPIDTIDNRFVSKVVEPKPKEPENQKVTETKSSQNQDDKVKELQAKLDELASKYNNLTEENALLKKELEKLG